MEPACLTIIATLMGAIGILWAWGSAKEKRLEEINEARAERAEERAKRLEGLLDTKHGEADDESQ